MDNQIPSLIHGGLDHPSTKHTLKVEKTDKGRLWGVFYYGEDLLISTANSEKELIEDINTQLYGFYNTLLPPESIVVQYGGLSLSEVTKVAEKAIDNFVKLASKSDGNTI